MKVEALKFDTLFMTVRADSSPKLNRAYANLFDFRPNFRPAGPKPKASYNIGYIYMGPAPFSYCLLCYAGVDSP